MNLLLRITLFTAALAALALVQPAVADDGPKTGVGKKQVGEASIYGEKFYNRKMADGERMDPNDDNAAHRTLPLGTKARVTNLETGKSTHVTIQDRGPFVEGRIIDLPPSKAEEIGLTMEEGVAKVKVEPIKIPKPDGSAGSGVSASKD